MKIGKILALVETPGESVKVHFMSGRISHIKTNTAGQMSHSQLERFVSQIKERGYYGTLHLERSETGVVSVLWERSIDPRQET